MNDDDVPHSPAKERRLSDAERFAHYRGISSKRDETLYKLREAEQLLRQASSQVEQLQRQLVQLEDELQSSR